MFVPIRLFSNNSVFYEFFKQKWKSHQKPSYKSIKERTKMEKKGSFTELLLCVILGLIINFSPLPGCVEIDKKDKAVQPKKETTTFNGSARIVILGHSKRLPNER